MAHRHAQPIDIDWSDFEAVKLAAQEHLTGVVVIKLHDDSGEFAIADPCQVGDDQSQFHVVYPLH